MTSIRSLLQRGNAKLGEGIHTWSLAAVSTCPGSTPTCRRACYAKRHHFATRPVKERMKWNLAQTKRDDFVTRMTREIVRKGVIVCRVHASGDFASKAYAEKWLAIIKACPKATFYAYSRSHVIPEIREVLALMALEPNCKIWFSLDADMEYPTDIPEGVRLCYLQVNEDDEPENVQLVFRVQKLRKIELPLLPICESETVAGKANEVTCGSCQKCYRD